MWDLVGDCDDTVYDALLDPLDGMFHPLLDALDTLDDPGRHTRIAPVIRVAQERVPPESDALHHEHPVWDGYDGKVDELGGTEDEDRFAPGWEVGRRDFFVDFRGGFTFEDTV